MEATKTAMPSNAEEGGEEEVEGGIRKARERKEKKKMTRLFGECFFGIQRATEEWAYSDQRFLTRKVMLTGSLRVLFNNFIE